MELNKEQTQAVNFKDGACLVIAGAGSGKTKVLTSRIVKLINDGISPHNILAITFTNKAAEEMRNRIYNELGNVADLIFIGTFHSLGFKILRENYDKLGFKNNITIMDSDDTNTIIKKILKELDKDPKQFNPRYIRNKISFAKNELMSPEEYSKYMFNDIDKVVIEVYRRYSTLLLENNSVDFDDLLMLPLKLFKKDKETLDKYQEHYKYLLVDEYQDTNTVQYEMCKILSSKYNNIFVVGDNDQSIYSFRYANFENVLNFEKDYKNATKITLEQNYRSTQIILNAANSVIKNNKQRFDKNLKTNNGEGTKINYLRCYDEKHEITTVTSEIKKLQREGTPLSEIAVFYRTNAQSRIVEEGFLKENIPYKIVGSYYFYNRKEIKDLISYLKLIYNPDDGISLTRAINTPKRGIGAKSIETLINKANAQHTSIFEAIEIGKELTFKNIILDLIDKSKNLTLTELIDEILLKSGMREALEKEKTLDAEVRLENLEEFKSITSSFEEKNGSISLEEFLDQISLVADVKEYAEDEQTVHLMTMHAAKGLEFDVVFIVGMEENIFPHSNSMNSNEEIEEERRLCYVGITRAKKKLFLLNSKRRMLYGKDQINSPSRFMKEIDEEYLESNKLVEKKIEKNKMYNENNNQDLSQGDAVTHDSYGTGVVIEINGNIAKIAFAHGIGMKSIIKTHKSLRKL